MLSHSATQSILLARLADSQDPTAWAEFVERYADLIRRFCHLRGLSDADTEDTLQDVLLSLTKSMPGFRYDPSKGKFRSYLKTVVVHAISKKLLQNPRHARLSAVGSTGTPADEADEALWESEWRQYHLRRALKTIEAEFSHSDRQAFERNALRGEPAQNVADALNISVDSVYQAKSRISRRLSALIRQQVEEEG
ncbi:MAG TPA: sigma-70 family RNA polymerase sigma factor [Phycisphaerales bacterium]|nr:sigma-70 family RNA polymerase sigma factor [Phycisphaerales bacterium]